jgi:hypothetical protein
MPLLYIDPGTGSIILQSVAAAVAGAAIVAKLYWHRILSFFGLRKNVEVDSFDQESDKDL